MAEEAALEAALDTEEAPEEAAVEAAEDATDEEVWLMGRPPPRAIARSLKAAQDSAEASSVLMQLQ